MNTSKKRKAVTAGEQCHEDDEELRQSCDRCAFCNCAAFFWPLNLKKYVCAAHLDQFKHGTMTQMLPKSKRIKLNITAGQQSWMERDIVLLSWNIEAAMKGRSDISPPGWTRQDNINRIRSTIRSHGPDIVALQECRSCTMDLSPDYIRVSAATMSHCGFVLIFVSRRFQQQNGIVVQSSQVPNTPSVLMEVSFGKRGCILGVASVHLAPYRSGEDRRLCQLQALLRHFEKRVAMRNVPLIIMGDTNMRVTETDKVERALNCRDVRTPLTFDTRVNWYHGKPTSDSRGGYASRYDRVLLRGSVRQSGKVTLVGAEPIDSHRPHHFLSDHFGLTVNVRLEDKYKARA